MGDDRDGDAGRGVLGRAARGSALNVAGAAVATAANLGLTVVVARLASQEVAGAFFSATSLFVLANGLGHLGSNTGLVYFLSGARARGQLMLAGAYMRIAARPVLVVSVVTMVVLIVFADPLGRALGSTSEVDVGTYLRWMALFLPFAAIANLALSGTRGLGTMRANAALDQALRPTLQLAVVAGLLMVGADTATAVGWSGVYVPIAAVGWWWWARLSVRAATGAVDSGVVADPRAFWKFSAPRALAGVTQMAMQRLDIVLVGALAGLSAAAIYAAATRFLVVGQMVGQAVSLGVQPQLGETLARGDLQRAGRLYQMSTAWLVLVTWPVYLSLVVFAPTVLALFGEDYSTGGAVVMILCATMLFATACGMVDMVLVMAGRPLWNLANVLAAFTVFLTLNLLLIPRLGVEGAAIAWASAIFAANVLPLLQVVRSLRLHPFGPETGLAAGVCVIAYGVVPAAIRITLGAGWVSLLVGVGVGTVVGLVLVIRLSEELGVRELLRALRAGRLRARS